MKKEHEKFLIEAFQSNHNNCVRERGNADSIGCVEDDFWAEPAADAKILDVDGIYGPKTAAEIDKYLAQVKPKFSMKRLWEVAYADVGGGGDPGKNNEGPYIDGLVAETEIDWRREGGPWCALAVSAWLRRAGYERWMNARSLSANRLTEGLVRTLSDDWEEVEPDDIKPGEYVIATWARARWATHGEAHIRVCCRLPSHYRYIAGNETGDRVVSKYLTLDQFEKRLIRAVRYVGK